MKILILGKNGQVGWQLHRDIWSAPTWQVESHDRTTVDVTDHQQLRAIIVQSGADIIINATAYTAIDKGEAEPEIAHAINHEAVAVMAEMAKHTDAWLIHYSTDYVFAGTGNEPHGESDPTNPLNVYGHSKLAGEHAIVDSGCQYTILRTSWVIGEHGHNFAKTILNLAQKMDTLTVVADQIGTPTTVDFIGKITTHIMEQMACGNWQSGIYHMVPDGNTSWYDIARLVVDMASSLGVQTTLSPDDIMPIRTAEYEFVAQRPLNSRLNNTKLQTAIGTAEEHIFPHWQIPLEKTIQKIITQTKVLS